jgi:hypothetical protein
LVSDVLSFYSFDGNDTTLTTNLAGSRPSIVSSSKSTRVSSVGSPQVDY